MAEEKFEDKMKRLEYIVNTLEKEEVDLDTSIKLFEEGLELSQLLNKQLSTYETKIDDILKDSEVIENE